MADLSQTPGNVKLAASGNVIVGTAAETITQGQPLYQVGDKWARARATTAVLAACRGIALTPALIDEPVVVARPGSEVNLGATLAVGEVYVVSATLGAIAPIGDLVGGNFVTPIGTARTAAILIFNPQPAGIAKV